MSPLSALEEGRGWRTISGPEPRTEWRLDWTVDLQQNRDNVVGLLQAEPGIVLGEGSRAGVKARLCSEGDPMGTDGGGEVNGGRVLQGNSSGDASMVMEVLHLQLNTEKQDGGV